MVRILAALLAMAALVACQQLPQSSSAQLMGGAAAGGSARGTGGPYRAAIVKDLEAVDAEMGAIFGAAFRAALQREGYLRVALPAKSDADVMTIQSAAMRVSASELEIAVAVRDAKGRLLDWYAVQYSGRELPGKDGQRRMFADAGAQVARAIATAR